ncbi:MAG: branched-chain amino acid ABC transporter permease, partial [Phycisphaerae bacterium]|nr:branched-chain amino acid ABC transporter permease [Phycisphaerae bacterium]
MDPGTATSGRLHDRPSVFLALPRALWPLVLSAAVAALLYFIVAPRIGEFAADLLINSGIAIILATSLTVVNGFTGQFSIGHAGFMSLGGYTAGAIVYYGTYRLFGDFEFHGGTLSAGAGQISEFLMGRADWLFLAALLAGAILAAIAGWLVGLPSLRLRGDYLAIVTLGFAEILRILFNNLDRPINITGGTNGIQSVDPWRIGSLVITGDKPYYYILVGFCALCVFCIYRWYDTRVGRAWVAI